MIKKCNNGQWCGTINYRVSLAVEVLCRDMLTVWFVSREYLWSFPAFSCSDFIRCWIRLQPFNTFSVSPLPHHPHTHHILHEIMRKKMWYQILLGDFDFIICCIVLYREVSELSMSFPLLLIFSPILCPFTFLTVLPSKCYLSPPLILLNPPPPLLLSTL